MKTIAVFAAHSDDEALGVGGTIARHCDQGDDVHLVFFTDGVGARGSHDNAKERNTASVRAAKELGTENIHTFSFPDNQMDTVSLLEVSQAIETVLETVNPEIIYTHHAGDLNVDHQIVNKAVLTACRPQPGSTLEAIYGFEVLSSTEWSESSMKNVFIPNHYVDVTNYFDKKLNALKCYDEEMRDFPHSRSYETVTALATLRGANVGVEKAEAFTVIRQIKF